VELRNVLTGYTQLDELQSPKPTKNILFLRAKAHPHFKFWTWTGRKVTKIPPFFGDVIKLFY